MEEHGGNEKDIYLAHYGVVGMRWGVRRYQPYSYTGSRRSGKPGKEIGEAAALGKKTGKKMGSVVQNGGIALAKAVKTHNEKKRERRRNNLINNGSVKEIKAGRGKYLTEDDIRKAIERIGNDNKLKDLESEANMKAVRRGKEALGLVRDMLSTGWSIYGTGKQISDELRNKQIDRAYANDDIVGLNRLLNSTTDRKARKDIQDLTKDLELKSEDKKLTSSRSSADAATIKNAFASADIPTLDSMWSQLTSSEKARVAKMVDESTKRKANIKINH